MANEYLRIYTGQLQEGNMTKDEIKKIAREYAEAIVQPDGFSAETLEELLEENESKAYSVLIAISKDYCIVPKDEIKSDYDSNAFAAGQFAKGSGAICAQMREWHQGKCDELISLFGKELFNNE